MLPGFCPERDRFLDKDERTGGVAADGVPNVASFPHIPPLDGKLEEKALLLAVVGVFPRSQSLVSLGEPLPIGSGSVL